MKKVVFGAALLAASSLAQAQGIYIGGGISSNDLDGWSDNATGGQFFAGFDLDMINLGSVKSAVEVGYMDSGDWEEDICYTYFGITQCATAKTSAKGAWANYVGSVDFTPAVSGIARAGFDFGDDDGFMFGAGLGFKATQQLEIRGEYVVRDHIDSLQANLVFHIK